MGKAAVAVAYLPQISPPLYSPRYSSLPSFLPGARLNLTAAAELRRSLSAALPSPPSLSSRRGQPRAFRFPVSSSPRRGPRRRQFEDDDDDDLWQDDAGDDDEEEEDEGDSSGEPLEEMRRWMENKPAGFGEGKTYDTSLENELFEEMERSRKAQVANLNKLKNEGNSKKKSPNDTSEDHLPKKQQQKNVLPLSLLDTMRCGAADMTTTGIRVRIWNLPKKKNIHRDLQLAFKGFPGIVSINPAVTGNEKTRDPICKGFAFLDLSSEEAASRFVQAYSNKNILFGKVQKQIDCTIMNQHHCSNSLEPSTALGQKGTIAFEKNEVSKSDFQLRETFADKTNTPVVDVFVGSEMTVINKGSDNYSNSSQEQKERRASKKKTVVKRISVKHSNTNLPGSASRLKIKERTILTGVFSKYGRKGAAEN